MTHLGCCPQCNQEIPADRYVSGAAVCKCGWFDPSPVIKRNAHTDKTVLKGMIGASIFLVVAYAHLMSWGSYAVAIPFVKLQQVTGTLSKAGYLELAQVCIDLNKFESAKNAYLDLYRSKRDIDGLAGLAKLQVRLGETKQSMTAFHAYFNGGGTDMDVALKYARVLESENQLGEAVKMYQLAADSSGDLLPVQATTGLVRLLIKQGQYQEAHDRIVEFHTTAENAKGYLNTELSQLESYLGKAAKAGRKAKPATKGKDLALQN